ncbi:uncharacterized protein PFL1_03726 [Pseudozyma flocculosa PF-1]|uniref:Uncharacterized protein n=1 Tax=Pseudozyma flocculosa PF-1 TaxID=1277687 RepID=A0A061HE89_9BASI|nr:uncharacterized protein PFL1_03726 [Pseudozyma flocculosa PF-1]EPQ28926.1 hypothetical protein PFL1_03726 [Pseudozyma flocculosa PF-1]
MTAAVSGLSSPGRARTSFERRESLLSWARQKEAEPQRDPVSDQNDNVPHRVSSSQSFTGIDTVALEDEDEVESLRPIRFDGRQGWDTDTDTDDDDADDDDEGDEERTPSPSRSLLPLLDDQDPCSPIYDDGAVRQAHRASVRSDTPRLFPSRVWSSPALWATARAACPSPPASSSGSIRDNAARPEDANTKHLTLDCRQRDRPSTPPLARASTDEDTASCSPPSPRTPRARRAEGAKRKLYKYESAVFELVDTPSLGGGPRSSSSGYSESSPESGSAGSDNVGRRGLPTSRRVQDNETNASAPISGTSSPRRRTDSDGARRPTHHRRTSSLSEGEDVSTPREIGEFKRILKLNRFFGEDVVHAALPRPGQGPGPGASPSDEKVEHKPLPSLPGGKAAAVAPKPVIETSFLPSFSSSSESGDDGEVDSASRTIDSGEDDPCPWERDELECAGPGPSRRWVPKTARLSPAGRAPLAHQGKDDVAGAPSSSSSSSSSSQPPKTGPIWNRLGFSRKTIKTESAAADPDAFSEPQDRTVRHRLSDLPSSKPLVVAPDGPTALIKGRESAHDPRRQTSMGQLATARQGSVESPGRATQLPYHWL